MLTSLWQAISSKDNDAVDRLFDSTSFAVTARASDGRGPAFWAWEYQNHYALGAIMAYGGDVLSTDEDLQGSLRSRCAKAIQRAKKTMFWRRPRRRSKTSRSAKKSARSRLMS